MEALGINWKILIGQIVNFTILFFLLKRFAFKPFLNMLEKRRKGIEDGLRKANEAEQTLQKIKELSMEVQEKGEKKARELMIKAESEARKRSEELLIIAETNRRRIIEEAKKTIEEETKKEKSKRDHEIISGTLVLAEKFLKEKFNKEKDEKLIKELISGLK